MKIRIIAALCMTQAALLMSAGHLQANVAEGRYYDRSAEGWFWYVDPPVTPDQDEEEPEPEEKTSPVIVMKSPEEPPSEPDKGPAPMSAAWFRENLQTYMDRAIDNPTKDNVEAYFLLQRVMMDKAEDFANMSSRVVMGDPLLDEVARRSNDPGTSKLQETISARERKKAFTEIVDKTGLAFFFSSDCEICANQATTLKYLQERADYQVLPVSLDGAPLRNGVFADSTVADTGQAENLGITEGPALFMMIPPDRWVPISYGVITQESLMSRVIMAAYDEGVISEETYYGTKPTAKKPSMAKNLNQVESLPEDSAELIKLLRNLEAKK